MMLNMVVDFAKSLGKIRPLNGVVNGPFVISYHMDNTVRLYREAGFPSVRLESCNWPSSSVLDTHSIFPLFHADPDDPRNYIFDLADQYMEPIVKNGSQIIFRLGNGIEYPTTFYTRPPQDYQKWAKICINIIRHYNEGWANGFLYNIKRFEIWNEANDNDGVGPTFWEGTYEQYLDLYRVAATAIKAHDPSLKVGGPVTSNIHKNQLVRPFLAYCRDRKLPLDFISWHCYDSSPQTVVRHAAVARALLNEYGFKKAENYCTEWRPMLIDDNEIDLTKNRPGSSRRDAFVKNRNHEAAAFAASALMLMQDSPMDIACFYSADNTPGWSMFDEWGLPSKVYFVFKAFNHLLQTPNRAAVEGTPGGDAVTLCAGTDDGLNNAGLLLSNFRGKHSQLTITLKNLPLTGKLHVERYLVDEKHEFERVGDESLDPTNPLLSVTMPPATVCLVRLIQK